MRPPCLDLARIARGFWAAFLLAAWELPPLLSRPNLMILDLKEQNTEQDTPVPLKELTQSPATEPIPVQECRGHFCNRMCTVWGLERRGGGWGPCWQGSSNHIIK